MTRLEALDKAEPDIGARWAEPWGKGARLALGFAGAGRYLAVRFADGAEMTFRWSVPHGEADYGDCPLDPPDVQSWKPELRTGRIEQPPTPRPIRKKPLSPYED